MRMYLLSAVMLLVACGCNGSGDSGIDDPMLLPEPAVDYFAQQKLDTARVQEWLDNGGSIDALDENCQSLLHAAAWDGDLAGVKFLLDNGAQVDCKIVPGNIEPLRLAAEFGHREIAELLISRGADVNVRDVQKYTPLHRAANNGHLPVVKLLLAHGAEIDCRELKECTPLYFAVANGHKEVVAYLLSHGAQADICDHKGHTPLHEAAHDDYVEIAKLLLERGVAVDAQTRDGYGPLHFAVQGGHYRLVEDGSGGWQKEKHENMEVTKLLLRHGANVNLQDSVGRTALDWAIFSVQDEIGALLRENGARTRLELLEEKTGSEPDSSRESDGQESGEESDGTEEQSTPVDEERGG